MDDAASTPSPTSPAPAPAPASSRCTVHSDHDHHRDKSRATFLSLPPGIRNHIYDHVYDLHKRHNHGIFASHERGAREVPQALSRTCRQIRLETLPYFFALGLVVFVVYSSEDVAACREWIAMVPRHAWVLVRSVRVKHAHTLPRREEDGGVQGHCGGPEHDGTQGRDRGGQVLVANRRVQIRQREINAVRLRTGTECSLHFEVSLDEPIREHAVRFWGHRREQCKSCTNQQGFEDCVPVIEGVMREMYDIKNITREKVGGMLNVLDHLVQNSQK